MTYTIIETGNWNVYLTSSAFLTLIGSAIENYENEVGGILVGSISYEWLRGKNKPVIKIHSCFPSVTAKGSEDTWLPNEDAFNRVKDFTKAYSLDVLGEYHSHTRGEAELSEDDIQYIIHIYEKKNGFN